MLFFSELDHYDVYISIFFILKTELKKKRKKKKSNFSSPKKGKEKNPRQNKAGRSKDVT